MPPLLFEIFPQLARGLVRDLRRAGREDLANQLAGLRVADRCRCGALACGTLLSSASTTVGNGGVDATLMLGNGNVSVSRGQIVSIETLSPEIEAVLRQLLP